LLRPDRAFRLRLGFFNRRLGSFLQFHASETGTAPTGRQRAFLPPLQAALTDDVLNGGRAKIESGIRELNFGDVRFLDADGNPAK